MIKIFFILNLISFSTFAQALLIPEKSVLLDEYLKNCNRPGYICTHDYFKNKILNSSSEKYDIFLDQLSLDLPDSLKQIEDNIKHLLKEEDLNLEQVQNLISILNKAKSLTNIEYQTLSDLVELTKRLKLADQHPIQPSEFYIVFRTVVSKEKFHEMGYIARQFKTHKINPYTFPSDTDFSDYLLTGTCDQHMVSGNFQIAEKSVHFQKMFTDSCSWGQKINKVGESLSEFSKNNKKAIIWTTVALTAVLFLNKYQVTLSY